MAGFRGFRPNGGIVVPIQSNEDIDGAQIHRCREYALVGDGGAVPAEVGRGASAVGGGDGVLDVVGFRGGQVARLVHPNIDTPC